MLDGEVAVETPDFCAVKAGAIYLGAVHIDDYQPPTWPPPERSQQLHLDLAVNDLDAAEAQAIQLGATKDSQQPIPERCRVLRDPAGHADLTHCGAGSFASLVDYCRLFGSEMRPSPLRRGAVTSPRPEAVKRSRVARGVNRV